MILPILMLAFLILIHELGHYFVGRYYGIGVKAFSIGFGPFIKIHTDKNGTEWRLSLIPLGGYVMFLDLDESLRADIEGSKDFVGPPLKETLRIKSVNGSPFQKASLPHKILTILAGPTVNLLAIYPLIFVALLLMNHTIQQNEIIDYRISEALSGYIEENALKIPKLKPGDRISEVNGVPVLTPSGIRAQLTVARYKGIEDIEVIIDKRYATQHEYEISLQEAYVLFSIIEFKKSGSFSNEYRILTHDLLKGAISSITSLPSIISHQVNDSKTSEEAAERVNDLIDSPIMIVKKQSDQLDGIGDFKSQLSFVLLMGAFISFMLGLLNLLPLSVLDGGQIVINIFEKIKEDMEIKHWIYDFSLRFYNFISLIAVLGLTLLSFGGDIWQLLT